MKLKTLLTTLTCFTVLTSFGQEISKTDILKFKIKSITTFDSDGEVKFVKFYNSKGDFIIEKTLNDDKKLQIRRERLYNGTNQLIEEQRFTSDGDINLTIKYFYDTQNKLIKKESIKLGQIDATWTFQYDKNGNKITETQTSEIIGNSLTKYEYDANRLLIQEDKSNNSIGKEERINYKYSDKRQLIEKKTKAFYFNTILISTYIYNDTERLIKQVEKSSNGVSSTTDHKYNDNGLLVSEIWQGSIGKIPHQTTYKIDTE